MSKYRFYIIDSEFGTAVCTNDEERAQSYYESFEYYVIDTERNIMLGGDDDEEIKELLVGPSSERHNNED